MTCNHALGLLSTMQTLKVTRDWYHRKCTVCGFTEYLRRAGKIYVGVSVEAEQLRDFERREFAKEHLQAYNVDGSTNELFEDAYGDPAARGKAKGGAKMDEMQIKPKKKKKKN